MAMTGILGTKLGMTQVLDETGQVVPVTVVQAGPCVVTPSVPRTTTATPLSRLASGRSTPAR